MFDKLVESHTAGAEFKNRSRYFMVSTVVVGVLFLTAVIYSLYAAEIGLGKANFEIADLLAPVDAVIPQEDPISERTAGERINDDRTSRRVVMEVTDTSTRIPAEISVTKNPIRTISADKFQNVSVGITDTDGSGRAVGGPACNISCTGSRVTEEPDEPEITGARMEPPPVIKTRPVSLRTSKVLNGSAILLPKPAYPQPAIVLNLQGSVKVQVTIDESGRVISAKAADGHPLFRQAAEQAARNAKFNPTYLNDAPVKVTGVIVYNFKRN